MRLLILTRSDNAHADAVQLYFDKHADTQRINLDFDTYPEKQLPNVSLGDITETHLTPDAIFLHHPRIGYRSEWFEDEIEKKLFISSWDSLKEWLEAQYARALWVNRPSRSLNGKNIFEQLRIAENLGFDVPETVFTNNLDHLVNFAGSDQIIIKQGNLGAYLPGKRILTSIIPIKDIEAVDLNNCPCLFQKYLPKRFELRVHVIGNNVLTCKISSQSSEKTKVDWRNYDLDNTPHEPYSLDDAVAEKCIHLVKNLGLEFGIIDIIVTPEGKLFFLECNSQGHWLWIEKMTGLPITKTLCDHLLNTGPD